MQLESISTAERLARWRRRVWEAIQAARVNPEFRLAVVPVSLADRSQLAPLGWLALESADMVGAERLFRAALHHNPYDAAAWLGLSRSALRRIDRRAYRQAAFDLLHLARDTPYPDDAWTLLHSVE